MLAAPEGRADAAKDEAPEAAEAALLEALETALAAALETRLAAAELEATRAEVTEAAGAEDMAVMEAIEDMDAMEAMPEPVTPAATEERREGSTAAEALPAGILTVTPDGPATPAQRAFWSAMAAACSSAVQLLEISISSAMANDEKCEECVTDSRNETERGRVLESSRLTSARRVGAGHEFSYRT